MNDVMGYDKITTKRQGLLVEGFTIPCRKWSPLMVNWIIMTATGQHTSQWRIDPSKSMFCLATMWRPD